MWEIKANNCVAVILMNLKSNITHQNKSIKVIIFFLTILIKSIVFLIYATVVTEVMQ